MAGGRTGVDGRTRKAAPEMMGTPRKGGQATEFDVAVIGAGLIGSAAAKYLAKAGLKALLVGVREGNENGIHGSHHDQARITRYSGPDRIWSHLAAASIDKYPQIESESGIRFHRDCGHLRCDLPAHHAASTLDNVRGVLSEMPVEAEELSASETRQRFPFLHFASDAVLHLEPGPAGIIHPRRLVQAQIAIARQDGALFDSSAATRLEKEGGMIRIHTTSGTHVASNVVLATGAYTSLLPLTKKNLNLSVRPETVLLVRVDPVTQPHLMSMPGIIWNFDHREDVPYAYILPPVPYDDGHHWLKIGADHDRDISAASLKDYDRYMRTEGSDQTARLLREVLLDLIPELSDAPVRSKPCMLTYTPKGYPLIDQLDDGLFVAAGGCGKSAKSSDMLGRLASMLVTGKSWPEPFRRPSFGVS